MGLFDGVAHAGECGTGASADLAAMMGWPVVLVLDVSGQAQSAAAVAKGFALMRPDVVLAGVVLNRVASPRHEALVRVGMAAVGIPVLGALPRRASIELPERHLGLVQAEEQPELAAKLAEVGAFVAEHIDIAALRTAATAALAPTNPLIGGWRKAGATILPFSPLADEAPDPSAEMCWLPGGYPELHAGKLAAAARFRTGLLAFAEAKPVHGECGGYMAMGAGLVDAQGQRHQMTGLLGLETSFHKRRMHLGYRLARLNVDTAGHAAGTRLRGHEFHDEAILRLMAIASSHGRFDDVDRYYTDYLAVAGTSAPGQVRYLRAKSLFQAKRDDDALAELARIPTGEAFDLLDAAIRELPRIEQVESTRDSLQIRAKLSRPRGTGECDHVKEKSFRGVWVVSTRSPERLRLKRRFRLPLYR